MAREPNSLIEPNSLMAWELNMSEGRPLCGGDRRPPRFVDDAIALSGYDAIKLLGYEAIRLCGHMAVNIYMIEY